MYWNSLFNDAFKWQEILIYVIVGPSKAKEKHRNVKKKKDILEIKSELSDRNRCYTSNVAD